ncbi:MAG: hypothetical protein E6Q36_05680 [Chryseobacterium sp.]|nr:MAG: hypothetical protein E6Q36_05680 [Chryseobacterium sp.]
MQHYYRHLKRVGCYNLILLLSLWWSPPPPTYSLYTPLILKPTCPPKKGLAYAYPIEQVDTVINDLCVSGTLRKWWHTGLTIPLTYIPALCCLGEAYQHFLTYFDPNYDGLLLVANEPDQEEQGNMSPMETAQLFIGVHNYCANCQLIGPGIASDETDGVWLLSFLQHYLALGGQLEWIVYWDSHQYISYEHAWTAYLIYGQGQCSSSICLIQWELNRRLDILNEVLPPKPLWVSEIGACDVWDSTWIRAQLDVLNNREDVVGYNIFISSVYKPFYQCSYRYETNGVLNSYGYGISE